ncbi:sulfotransferase [Mesonia mobilis]|uniref:Sulfotransferase family protein n=1 Tax=Mesonia mobilis TaxID=369791 RepID=A0ABQ3BSI4_9FLAO|nr:sulfotransferase [Mesonia mobilis]MBQ0737714.1 hypothetical protein [Aquimarina celericrescens]GGZ53446.1 hypothetical protein GCM10008088_13910 [Mesonia mobilis]
MIKLFDSLQPSKEKIFCISFQRTGTTSVGQFFKDFGYRVAGYNAQRSTAWSKLRFLGDFDAIFHSSAFKKSQVFEDNPWFSPEFYKILYHRFPASKYILFTRDADLWFDSMVNHSQGKTLGNTYRHCKMYDRELEFFEKFPDYNCYENLHAIDNLLDLNESHREHYTSIYRRRNKEVIDFFNYVSPESLFVGQLEDPDKWQKLGGFFNLTVPEDYSVHSNKTKR